MFDINNNIELWKAVFFTQPVMFFVELITLIILLRNNKGGIGSLFVFFVAIDLAILISDEIIVGYYGYRSKTLSLYAGYTNLLISAIELIIYNCYFYKILRVKKLKPVLIASSVVYTLITIIHLITRFEFLTVRYAYVSRMLHTAELILLLPFCCIYFIQLFKKHSREDLLDRPSFWIVTGLFFYSLISIPVEMLGLILSPQKLFYIFSAIFFYLPLIINFICIAKAFLCRKPLTV